MVDGRQASRLPRIKRRYDRLTATRCSPLCNDSNSEVLNAPFACRRRAWVVVERSSPSSGSHHALQISRGKVTPAFLPPRIDVDTAAPPTSGLSFCSVREHAWVSRISSAGSSLLAPSWMACGRVFQPSCLIPNLRQRRAISHTPDTPAGGSALLEIVEKRSDLITSGPFCPSGRSRKSMR